MSRLRNRYQRFCDFSGLLDAGRAILVTRGTPPGSQLLRDDQPLASSHDRAVDLLPLRLAR